MDDEAYSYDGVGNRLTDIQRRNYTYNNGNELLSQNGTSFQYDANGNMVAKIDSTGTTRYTYSTENQLIKVELPDVGAVPFHHQLQNVAEVDMVG